MVSRDHSAPTLAFRFDGTFDVDAAIRLMEAMLAAPGDAEIYIDFSRVHDFRDTAVAVLSQALSRVGARASVQGLCQHQYRLLQYLGAPSSALGPLH